MKLLLKYRLFILMTYNDLPFIIESVIGNEITVIKKTADNKKGSNLS